MGERITDTKEFTIKLKAPPTPPIPPEYPSWMDFAPIVAGLLLIALSRM